MPEAAASVPYPRVLLIAYGNNSRRDDGVAFHILERLLARMGLDEHDLEARNGSTDEGRLATLRLHQLAPELAETVAAYDEVVFIDAHVDAPGWSAVQWRGIQPVYEAGMVGHHLKPGVVLALCRTLYGAAPRGLTLSVLGHDFDFGESLSPATSLLADEAVGQLQGHLTNGVGLSPVRDAGVTAG